MSHNGSVLPPNSGKMNIPYSISSSSSSKRNLINTTTATENNITSTSIESIPTLINSSTSSSNINQQSHPTQANVDAISQRNSQAFNQVMSQVISRQSSEKQKTLQQYIIQESGPNPLSRQSSSSSTRQARPMSLPLIRQLSGTGVGTAVATNIHSNTETKSITRTSSGRIVSYIKSSITSDNVKVQPMNISYDDNNGNMTKTTVTMTMTKDSDLKDTHVHPMPISPTPMSPIQSYTNNELYNHSRPGSHRGSLVGNNVATNSNNSNKNIPTNSSVKNNNLFSLDKGFGSTRGSARNSSRNSARNSARGFLVNNGSLSIDSKTITSTLSKYIDSSSNKDTNKDVGRDPTPGSTKNIDTGSRTSSFRGFLLPSWGSKRFTETNPIPQPNQLDKKLSKLLQYSHQSCRTDKKIMLPYPGIWVDGLYLSYEEHQKYIHTANNSKDNTIVTNNSNLPPFSNNSYTDVIDAMDTITIPDVTPSDSNHSVSQTTTVSNQKTSSNSTSNSTERVRKKSFLVANSMNVRNGLYPIPSEVSIFNTTDTITPIPSSNVLPKMTNMESNKSTNSNNSNMESTNNNIESNESDVVYPIKDIPSLSDDLLAYSYASVVEQTNNTTSSNMGNVSQSVDSTSFTTTASNIGSIKSSPSKKGSITFIPSMLVDMVSNLSSNLSKPTSSKNIGTSIIPKSPPKSPIRSPLKSPSKNQDKNSDKSPSATNVSSAFPSPSPSTTSNSASHQSNKILSYSSNSPPKNSNNTVVTVSSSSTVPSLTSHQLQSLPTVKGPSNDIVSNQSKTGNILTTTLQFKSRDGNSNTIPTNNNSSLGVDKNISKSTQSTHRTSISTIVKPNSDKELINNSNRKDDIDDSDDSINDNHTNHRLRGDSNTLGMTNQRGSRSPSAAISKDIRSTISSKQQPPPVYSNSNSTSNNNHLSIESYHLPIHTIHTAKTPTLANSASSVMSLSARMPVSDIVDYSNNNNGNNSNGSGIGNNQLDRDVSIGSKYASTGYLLGLSDTESIAMLSQSLPMPLQNHTKLSHSIDTEHIKEFLPIQSNSNTNTELKDKIDWKNNLFKDKVLSSPPSSESIYSSSVSFYNGTIESTRITNSIININNNKMTPNYQSNNNTRTQSSQSSPDHSANQSPDPMEQSLPMDSVDDSIDNNESVVVVSNGIDPFSSNSS